MPATGSADKKVITIKIGDDSIEMAPGAVVKEILQSRPKKPDGIIAALFNGVAIDLDCSLSEDGELSWILGSDPQGLVILYHSTAHLMAQVVIELFPEAKLAIGPAIENGFYYDFDVDKPFTPEDLEKIEIRMKELIKERIPLEHYSLDRDAAISYYKERNQDYKIEMIEGFEDSSFTFYKQGDFTDMCRGPHVPHTGCLKHFKILHNAGAYWRGDEHRPMLQRIYGTAAASKKDLKEYLKKLEEAKERDHRKIGKELDLYSIHEEAGPGLVFWHPQGARIRNVIETFWREEHYKHGYEQVNIPHLLKGNLFEQSGHLENYKENMYSPMDIDGSDYYAKPMNCPGHILIYKTHLHSYRELPIRYAELGTVYRYERSGALHGLLRVRGFTQDDAHIFCTTDQLEDEINGVIRLADFMMQAFGFEYEMYLATRPEKWLGTDEMWDHATDTLRDCLEKTGKPWKLDEGGGVFYGPKIDVKLFDALGRTWQGPTFQLDFNLPERFDVNYIDTNGDKKRVVMIHRTVLGSMERFMGNLIEHYKGAFPGWLAPVQVKVLPITDDQISYAQDILLQLRRDGIRCEIDQRNEKIGFKIREAEAQKVPVMLVVGKREVDENTVSVRERGRNDLGVMTLENAHKHIATVTAIPKSDL
jgi:threonyl-tRNA synthetase